MPLEKLTDYLLARSHPIGGPKARFFLAHGYTEERAAELERSLLAIAREAEAVVVESQHGKKYVAEGLLSTPHGTNLRIRTVWILERNALRPRFVTAYPV